MFVSGYDFCFVYNIIDGVKMIWNYLRLSTIRYSN